MKKLDTQQKRWVGIVAVLLAVILALGITLGVATKWGKDLDNLTPKQEEAALGNVGGGMVVGEAEETGDSGLSLLSTEIPVAQYEEYGIAPIAESAFTVTATVKDSSASTDLDDSMQKFKWEMGWKGGSGTGEPSTYVTMSESGGKTATFSCLGAFTTQIVVTCTWTINTGVTAQVTLDYAKKAENITVSYNKDELVDAGTVLATEDVELDGTVYRIGEKDEGVFKLSNAGYVATSSGLGNTVASKIIKFGKDSVKFSSAGTVENSVTSITGEFSLDSTIISALPGAWSGIKMSGKGSLSFDSSSTNYEMNQRDFIQDLLGKPSNYGSIFAMNFSYANVAVVQETLEALCKGDITFTIKINFKYGNPLTAKFVFDSISVDPMEGSLQLDHSSHIF